jgi:hypothetical protein
METTFCEIVEFEEGESLDSFLERINHRYEEGDTKVMKQSDSGFSILLQLYQMNKDGEWALYWPNCSFGVYINLNVTLKIFPDITSAAQLLWARREINGPDYVLPLCRLALLNKERTDKLRRKRVKPACIKEKEEIYQEE